MRRPPELTALLLLGLSTATSCSRHAAPPAPAQPAPATAPAPAGAPAAGTTPAPVAAAAESETEQAVGAQESADGAAGEKPDSGDTSLERMATLPADAQLPTGRWKPGVSYEPVVPEQPTSVEPEKVEVIEFMWLGSPHCYTLEPAITAWLKARPAYVVFVRVPVVWGVAQRAHARLLYTLNALGRADLIDKAFESIQQQHNPLTGGSDAETLRVEQGWAVQQGISAGDFANAYNSPAVSTSLQRAGDLALRYRIQGVPAVVINGKYLTDVARAGNAANLIQLIGDLAAAEHRH